jgi:hypothetical protein
MMCYRGRPEFLNDFSRACVGVCVQGASRLKHPVGVWQPRDHLPGTKSDAVQR